MDIPCHHISTFWGKAEISVTKYKIAGLWGKTGAVSQLKQSIIGEKYIAHVTTMHLTESGPRCNKKTMPSKLM